ncbi:hypothetical protein GCM10009827_055760 [Dactylosporangium maewongense]|uniref:Uncharacterized protein n=1 Tax=Dactylosporangium maewongense TaxID=634393 RepID=A0ABN2B2C2_9ACTN
MASLAQASVAQPVGRAGRGNGRTTVDQAHMPRVNRAALRTRSRRTDQVANRAWKDPTMCGHPRPTPGLRVSAPEASWVDAWAYPVTDPSVALKARKPSM